MNKILLSLNLLFFSQYIECRDFYLGMFRRNDFLVAQDTIYKEASHFGYATASYGRVFKCPITYFRVVDRLGMGRGPYTTVVRGGLKKNYIAVRIRSTYNIPVSVNVYVGCENKAPMKPMTRATEETTVMTTDADEDENGDDGEAGDDAKKGENADDAKDKDKGEGDAAEPDPAGEEATTAAAEER